MDKIKTALICLLIFFLPLLILPIGLSYFEIPKVIAAELIIELLVILTIYQNKLNLRSFLNPAGVVIGLLIILTIIDLIFFKTETTLFGNSFRLQGIFLLWHLMALSVISSRINLPDKIYRFALFVLAILTISAYLLGGDINGRGFGTLGEANSLAGVAIFLLPFGLINSPKWSKFASLFLAGLIILASGSRAGASALLIQLTFMGLIYIAKFNLTKSLILSILLGAGGLILPIWIGGGWYENRAEIWYTSLVAGSLSPVIGHGFGNTQQAIHQASLILNNNIQYQLVDSAHNFLLDIWVQAGAVGVLLITILLIISISNFVHKKQYLLLTCLLGLLVVLSFNPVSVSILVYFWWLLGQGFRNNS